MASNIGNLSVKLSADIAEYQQKLKQAEDSASGFKDKVSSHLASVNNLLGTMFAGFAVNALEKQFWGVVDGMNALKDAAQKTGASVENLSALKAIAAETGTTFENASELVDKLNRALQKSTPDNAIGLAFKAIGVDFEELKQMDPAQALLETAKAFTQFADDGNKARAMQILLKGATAEQIAYMNDLAEAGQLNGKVTTEQAEQADELNKKMIEVKKIFAGFTKGLVTEAIPVVLDLVKAFTDSADKADVFSNKATVLKTIIKGVAIAVLETKYIFTEFGRELGTIAAQIAAMGRGDFKNAFGPGGMGDQRTTQAEIARREHDKQFNAILNAGDNPNAPRLPDTRKSIGVIRADTESSGLNRAERKDPGIKNYATLQEDLNKIILKTVMVTDNLTDSEKKLQEYQVSDKWNTLTDAQKASTVARVEAIAAIERQKAATDAFNKTLKEASDSERQAEYESLGLSDAQKKLLAIESSPDWAKYSIAQRQKIIATYEAKDASDELRKSQARLQELLTDSSLEKARSDMLLLVDAFQKGTISQEAFNEAVSRRLDLKAPLDNAKESVLNLSTAMSDASNKMADSMIAFAATGKASFSDMTNSILSNIAKMIVQQMIFNAIKTGMNAASGSSIGWLASIGSAFGGTTAKSANGNVFSSGSLIPFANGGTVLTQPTRFAMANGGTGLAGEAGIEGVFPLTRINGKLGIQASGAGNVVNNSTVNQITVNVQGGQTNAETANTVSVAVVRAIAQDEIIRSRKVGGINNPMQISSR